MSGNIGWHGPKIVLLLKGTLLDKNALETLENEVEAEQQRQDLRKR